MTLELLLLPLFPHSSTQILCFTSGMKAIVGVAGGASRATITQHHAIRGNTGDVSAKDGSQETCVNLVASVLGVFILSVTEHSLLLWLLFSFVTTLHLFANYKAVRSLKLTTFNLERLVLFLNTYLNTSIIQPPEVVNSLESVIVGKGYSDMSGGKS
uniref:Protein root UVB sensitive/RUS domain-containing protein n=1 Tax=Clastoptera arizonana TaxID=38151 RepID=A0A1B6E741_9HEMI